LGDRRQGATGPCGRGAEQQAAAADRCWSWCGKWAHGFRFSHGAAGRGIDIGARGQKFCWTLCRDLREARRKFLKVFWFCFQKRTARNHFFFEKKKQKTFDYEGNRARR
jgi:hypothetical protein